MLLKVKLVGTMLFLFGIGCVSTQYTRYYLYEDQPQSKEQVAAFVMQRDIFVLSLTDVSTGKNQLDFSAENPSPMIRPFIFDLPAGEYTIKMSYLHSGSSSWSSGDPINVNVSAQAGHVYYFYRKNLPSRKWQIVIESFPTTNELLAFKTSFWDDWEDGKRIQKRLDQHFNAMKTQSVFFK